VDGLSSALPGGTTASRADVIRKMTSSRSAPSYIPGSHDWSAGLAYAKGVTMAMHADRTTASTVMRRRRFVVIGGPCIRSFEWPVKGVVSSSAGPVGCRTASCSAGLHARRCPHSDACGRIPRVAREGAMACRHHGEAVARAKSGADDLLARRNARRWGHW